MAKWTRMIDQVGIEYYPYYVAEVNGHELTVWKNINPKRSWLKWQFSVDHRIKFHNARPTLKAAKEAALRLVEG